MYIHKDIQKVEKDITICDENYKIMWQVGLANKKEEQFLNWKDLIVNPI